MERPPICSSRPPLGERAQAGPVGYLLIVGLTVSVATGIVIFGGSIIEASQTDSQINQAELALTQFDSTSAQVALDEADQQSVSLGTRAGSYRIDENAGEIRIYHGNWTGTGDREPIYGTENDPIKLGSVVYERGGTTIAYQGGGVWRKDADGGSTMVSSPEFQYRSATLTFPVIRVTGSGAASGRVRSSVTKVEATQDVFPDRTGMTTNVTDQYNATETYSNPIANGTMTVEIQSEYCGAWKRYFEDRTEGKVSECDENGTVTAAMVTLGTYGDFDVTSGSSAEFRDVDGETIDNFDLVFESDSESSFNNFDWKMATDEDAEEQFEIFVDGPSQSGDAEPVHVHIYYSNDGGDTYHSWVLDKDSVDAFEQSGEGSDAVISIDLLDSSRDFNYTDIEDYKLASGKSGPVYDGGNGQFIGNESINGTDYYTGDREALDEVVKHYMGLAAKGDLNLKIRERQPKQGQSGLSDESNGYITYEGGGRVVTFLHITENTVEVRLE